MMRACSIRIWSRDPETLELDLFDWRAIPWDELAFPSVHWVLRRALELKDQDGPYLPAFGP